MSRSARFAVVGVTAAVLLTGCGPTLGDMPLPGSGVSGDTITLKADFDEALNLAQGAIVKVNGVDAGRVQEVTLQDFQAQAEMLVQTKAQVRDGATARLRYNTPLGELFVDITNPTQGTLLAAGATLTDEFTSTAPTVEDALASASLLINGGGLGQLQNVTEELNQILDGREDTVRDLLAQSNAFLTQANAATADVGRTLESLNEVAQVLSDRQETIHWALQEIRPAAAVVRENTAELTKLLQSLRTFSGNANQIVQATREKLLYLVRESAPVLAELNKNSDGFAASLDGLIRLAKALDGIIHTDWANLGVLLPLDGTTLDGGDDGLPIPIPTLPPLPIPTPTLPGITLPPLPGITLPPLPGLPLGLRASSDDVRSANRMGDYR